MFRQDVEPDDAAVRLALSSAIEVKEEPEEEWWDEYAEGEWDENEQWVTVKLEEDEGEEKSSSWKGAGAHPVAHPEPSHSHDAGSQDQGHDAGYGGSYDSSHDGASGYHDRGGYRPYHRNHGYGNYASKGKGYGHDSRWGNYGHRKGLHKGKAKTTTKSKYGKSYPHWAYSHWKEKQTKAGIGAMKGREDNYGGLYTATGYQDRDGNEWEFLELCFIKIF